MVRVKPFTDEQVAYLESLPAVDHVTSTRITYSKDFRRRSLARYLHGASPTALFREAGLDPKLVGYKRIERCFARWKEQAEADGTIDDIATDDTDERKEGTPRGNDLGRDGAAPHDESASPATGRGMADAITRHPHGDGPDITASLDRHAYGPTAVTRFGSDASPDTPDTDKTIPAGDASADPRDLLIARQARRIAELEQEIRELRGQRR